MAAPRSGGFPPLFWIILAGLAVVAAIAFFLYGGSREGSQGIETPVNRELGPPPSVRPPDAAPGAPTVPSDGQQPVAPSGAGLVAPTPPTGQAAPNVDAPAPPPAT